MSTEACLLALNCAMNEIKRLCPAVQSAFMFKKNKQILARDRDTDELTINDAITSFYALNKRANAQGGINAVTFQGLSSRMIITQIDNFYLATVVGNEVDEKILRAVYSMVIPVVLRVLDVVHPTFIATQSGIPLYVDDAPKDAMTETLQSESPTEDVETIAAEEQSNNPEVFSEVLLPEPPVSQFIVGSINGIGRIIGSNDIVYIDGSVIAKWESLYEDRKIGAVEVEEIKTGKKALFKFKPIKDSKLDSKAIIQMPEKAQQTIQTQKGALVTVKPVIDQKKGDSDD